MNDRLLANGSARQRAGALAAAAVATLVLSGGTRAHHSLSRFDVRNESVIEGEVVKFEWTNPHTVTWINVENADGTLTTWRLEGMSPDYLGRRGWTRTALEPGDRIEVVIYPLKDGGPGGTFLRATLEDGTVRTMFDVSD